MTARSSEMRMPVRTVALCPHPERASAHAIAARVARRLAGHGIDVVVEPELAGRIAAAGSESADGPEALRLEAVPPAADGIGFDGRRIDLTIAVGGDGTLLRAFQFLPDVPVVGVHCGDLGHLALVDEADADTFCDVVAARGVEVEERIALRVGSRSAGVAETRALNDVVVAKGPDGRVPKMRVIVDGEPFVSLLADAVVAATPTGSTAYNFSARGPIVVPDASVFVLTPVAPHSLWDRSLVLPLSSRVELEIAGDRVASLLADGRSLGPLQPGDVVQIDAGAVARTVRWGGDSFTSRVRASFGLAGRRF